MRPILPRKTRPRFARPSSRMRSLSSHGPWRESCWTATSPWFDPDIRRQTSTAARRMKCCAHDFIGTASTRGTWRAQQHGLEFFRPTRRLPVLSANAGGRPASIVARHQPHPGSHSNTGHRALPDGISRTRTGRPFAQPPISRRQSSYISARSPFTAQFGQPSQRTPRSSIAGASFQPSGRCQNSNKFREKPGPIPRPPNPKTTCARSSAWSGENVSSRH